MWLFRWSSSRGTWKVKSSCLKWLYNCCFYYQQRIKYNISKECLEISCPTLISFSGSKCRILLVFLHHIGHWWGSKMSSMNSMNRCSVWQTKVYLFLVQLCIFSYSSLVLPTLILVLTLCSHFFGFPFELVSKF